MSITFADLPLRPETQAALAEHGFKSPFPIQEMVLPIALGDGDVIGQAKTGTGKTLAFGIPLIERVIAPLDKEWDALVAKRASTSTCCCSYSRTLRSGYKRYR